MKKLILVLLLIISGINTSYSQRGKNSNYTVSALNTIVNTYTTLTTDASVGGTSISVASNALSGAVFAGNLAQGDLIMIVQMQGVPHYLTPTTFGVDIDYYPSFAYGASAVPFGYSSGAYQNAELYGRVLDYVNSGNYEVREVLSVSGTSTINLTCGLEKNYSASGHVQVVRIPRFTNLTINAGTSITSPSWDGSIGGIVSAEVNGALQLDGSINVSAKGFRGGQLGIASETAGNVAHTSGPGNGDSYLGSNGATKGGATGESIFGYTTEYANIYIGYGRGAVTNGGGGGGIQNAGGGGGSNVGSTIGYTGKGIPTPGYASFWNAEKAGMATTLSGGGGRGGYTYANTQNFGVSPYVGPNNTGWGGNARKENGGYGGHPIDYNPAKLFLGGGGGAGGQDSGQGGRGGNGGGIVFLITYGTVAGSGTIIANGENGEKTNPTNDGVNATSKKRRGNDGAGGGGGGGYIYIKSLNPVTSSATLQANGGNGGTIDLSFYLPFGIGGTPELTGPGAGGAGGGIAFTAGSPTTTISGGAPGGTLSNGSQNPMSVNFPMNGATSGGVGLTNLPAPTFDIIVANDTICGSQSTTLTASVVGTFPGGSSIGWYTLPFGGSPVATGTSFTTPVLGSTTTYYVGNCPGTFRKPVKVVVGSSPIISGTAVITNATCSTGGSITGLTASGGTGTLTYSWNGTASAGTNLSNASPGSYTLTVTDANGCSSQSGPHVISGVGGPSITGTPTITPQTCTTNGSITGLTVSSPVAITNYDWSGTTTVNQNLSAAAGTYTLTVTDANGCTSQSGPYTITSAPIPVITGTAVITNANCNTGGSITGLTASGGVGTLTYSWNGTASAGTNLTNATAGSYTLTVTDANGCTAQSGPYQINTDSSPTISGTPTITNATCIAQGSITGLTVSGGTGTLTYTWNGASSAGADLTNAAAGSYTLVVTDANGCSAQSGPHVISSSPTFTITGTAVITNANCNNNGSITGLTITGGTPTFQYVWNSTSSTTIDLTNATAGSYTLHVVDGNGCTGQSGPYQINTDSSPTISGTPTITNVNCNGNGSITGLTASGGTGTLTYSWNGTASAGTTLTNSTAGSYTLTVTDANGCTAVSGPHQINTDSSPTISGTPTITNATCTTQGSITGLTVSGGTGTLTYTWNGVSSVGTSLTNVPAGSYTLVVTDANGCSAQSGPHVISSIGGPIISGTPVITNETCTVLGSITGLTASGGTGTLIYSWNGTATTNGNLTGATAGSYTLTVVDGSGCSVQSGPHIIGLAPTPSINGTATTTDATCNQGGSITGLSVSSGTQPYQYAWNGTSSSTIDLTNASAGSYTLTVTDANGCVITSGPYTIGSIGTVSINGTAVITAATCQTGGAISGLTANGGTAPYTYEWNGVTSTTPDVTDLQPGNYTLVIEDDNGCTATSLTYTINAPAMPVIGDPTAVVNANCLQGGSITGITITGGTGPYSYSWNNGQYSTLDITNITQGIYTLTVTDANGCSTTATPITVGEDVFVDAQFTYLPSTVLINETVQFHDESIGNIVAWEWHIDTSTVTIQHPSYTFTQAGMYDVTLIVTDINGCIDSIKVTIEVISNLEVPNVITVNGDGINDLFVLKGLLPNTRLIILNRWGELIYTNNNYDNSWDGRDMSGKMVTEGVYTYLVTMDDGNKKHGFVHVVVKH